MKTARKVFRRHSALLGQFAQYGHYIAHPLIAPALERRCQDEVEQLAAAGHHRGEGIGDLMGDVARPRLWRFMFLIEECHDAPSLKEPLRDGLLRLVRAHRANASEWLKQWCVVKYAVRSLIAVT
jgi:hypothetical protein